MRFSLRGRLTLIYALLLGGLLLIAALGVYGVVGLTWQARVDEILQSTAARLQPVLIGQGASSEAFQELALSTRPDVVVQVLSPQGRVLFFNRAGYRAPLYPGRDVLLGVRYVTVPGELRPDLRVLTIPLQRDGRVEQVLQVAMLVDVATEMQSTLLQVMLLFLPTLAGMALLIGNRVMQRALRPLEHLAERALEINRAADLSMRIPLPPYPDDEIGQVVQAFNTTLERLENLFDAQQRFLADVSHELRTPLTVIKANLGLMRRMSKPDADLLDDIEAEADRLTRMVESLLLLARAEAGRLPLNLAPVDLDALLFDTLAGFQALAAEKVRLELADWQPVRVVADPDRIKQVLVNLVSNAIKYTPPGGVVTLSLTADQTHARLTVRDTGPGIPPEDLPHIFDRFYRAEKSRTRHKEGGFGLGLSIAYWIVRGHGGTIEVESQLGQGTDFTVLLPLLAEHAFSGEISPNAAGRRDDQG